MKHVPLGIGERRQFPKKDLIAALDFIEGYALHRDRTVILFKSLGMHLYVVMDESIQQAIDKTLEEHPLSGHRRSRI